MRRYAIIFGLLFACSPDGPGLGDSSTADAGSDDVGRIDVGAADASGDTTASDAGRDTASLDMGEDMRRPDGGSGIETTEAECMDELDNDGDGLIDCDDPGCIRTCFDAGPDTGPPVDRCVVSDGMDAIGECEERAPPESFDAEVQWMWPGMGTEIYSLVTPLVANLTDDDDNGSVDLCDIPDVVVVMTAIVGSMQPGHIYVLDGETGVLNFRIPTVVDATVTPAIGDIDGDGIAEIVSVNRTEQLVAFEHDGTLKWTASGPWGGPGTRTYGEAIALADVDNDGDVEIGIGNSLHDHLGNSLWVAGERPLYSATTIADMDGDGDLELVIGHSAYQHDGTQLYRNAAVQPGFPQVADLDGDGLPEVLITNTQGITVLEQDGTLKYGPVRPTGASAGGNTWNRPATIHDFDGDRLPEYAMSSSSTYTVYEADATIVWSAMVADASGIAAGTAFDFLGDGVAEAMYADESRLFVFDGMGDALLDVPRTSLTLTEYPVVVDVDNDGSAEIVVISNRGRGGSAPSPAVQVIRDREDRWIQARRIWNQHTYHVTNVREDSTIPRMEAPSHLGLNTFRTNAQIEGGMLCNPNL